MSGIKLKKGDKVVMHTCMEADSHDGHIWTCRTDERKLQESHNYTVVWLEGYSGCFKSEFLQKVNVDDLIQKVADYEDVINYFAPDYLKNRKILEEMLDGK
jgi:hypothetical protein